MNLQDHIVLITSIITLISTILGLFKEAHSLKKEEDQEKKMQSQHQIFNNISAQDHSNITITAHQHQNAYDLSSIQYEEIKQKEFEEKTAGNMNLLKISWIILFVICLLIMFINLSDKNFFDIFTNTLILFILFPISISISTFIIRIIQQVKFKFYSVYEMSTLATILRYVQFYAFPLINCISEILLLILLNTHFETFENNLSTTICILIPMILCSLYLCNQQIELILFHNMKKISFKEKNYQLVLSDIAKSIVSIFIIILILYYFDAISSWFSTLFEYLNNLISELFSKLSEYLNN